MIRYLLIFLFLFAGCVTTTSNLDERVAALEDEVIMLQASQVGAATKMYGRDCIDTVTDGCAKSLDSIDTTGWTTDDYRAMVLDPTDKMIAMFYYDADSVAVEDYPLIVSPTAGSGRWYLHESGVRGRIQFAVSDPENLPTWDAGRSSAQSMLVWYNDTGVTFNIETIRAVADTDNYVFDLYVSASKTDVGGANDSRVDTGAITCSIEMTSGGYYIVKTSGDLEHNTIANEQYLIFEHNSGSADGLHVYIEGYFY